MAASLPSMWPRDAGGAFLHAVAVTRAALLDALAGFENSTNPRARLLAEVARLTDLVAMLREENRILRNRLEALPPRERPHYAPSDRWAILTLRARVGWNAAETARRFLVSAATIAGWTRRVDEGGRDALVQPRVPINRFPAFVTALVHQLRGALPTMGRRKLADVLARAGIHLSASTVRRMLAMNPPSPTSPDDNSTKSKHARKMKPRASSKPRVVGAKYPHHLWHVDITLMPTALGFWVPWFPATLLPAWPFCWHIGVVVDHFSRSFVAFGVFRKSPSGEDICALLNRARMRAGKAPKHIVTDQGAQFQDAYLAWCTENNAKPRFGAIGKHGSIALVERFIRTLKDECLRRTIVPLNATKLHRLVDQYGDWYNLERPHQALGGCTPAEVRDGVMPARRKTALETREKYPRRKRGDEKRPATRRIHAPLKLIVTPVSEQTHLAAVRLREAA